MLLSKLIYVLIIFAENGEKGMKSMVNRKKSVLTPSRKRARTLISCYVN